jgi:hypothetical protein
MRYLVELGVLRHSSQLFAETNIMFDIIPAHFSAFRKSSMFHIYPLLENETFVRFVTHKQ